MEMTEFLFVTTCLLAASPTILSPFLNATTDGVVLFPSGFVITVGSPFSRTATHEFVVPKSIPIIFSAIFIASYSLTFTKAALNNLSFNM